jgi:outer membrane cobalamin receptor
MPPLASRRQAEQYRRVTLLVSLVFLAVVTAAAPPGSHQVTIEGTVVDASGAPVGGARIAAAGGEEASVLSGSDGRFQLRVEAAEQVDVVTTAPGFAEARSRERIPPGLAAVRLRITLLPAPLAETLVVTATRGVTRTADTAAPVSVLTSADLLMAPSPALDDALRVVPGFSLFRRTSSRAANPTTQGASLRGLAASGASRALVLADGMPLNDPFGGWVYWNRVPQVAVDRVEVVRGGVSDVYGVDALAGVIQILTDDRRGPSARAAVEGGSHATARASLFTALTADAWRVSATGEASRTEGTWVVEEPARGPIDAPAGGDYLSGAATVAYQRPGGWQARLRADAFGESRRNGTLLQENDTSTRQVRADLSGQAFGGLWEVGAQGGDQAYRQSFSAIAAQRAVETLTTRQRVPASQALGSVAFRRMLGSADLLAGGDLRQVVATNEETGFGPTGAVTRVTATRGFQQSSGAYAQLRAPLGARTAITAGLRGDLWQPQRGGDGSRTVFSPRLAASFRLAAPIVLRGSVTSSFRAPTLNERYRAFRVGNVVTNANAALVPEELLTIEGGALIHGSRGSVRATVFQGTLDNAVTNVTISTTPQLITRQRQNAGGVRATGLEVEGEWRTGASWTWTGAMGLTRSRFRATEGLTGNTVPQVPDWQLSAGARWLAPTGTTVQGLVRAFGDQFEDDRNTLTLRGGAILDASVSHAIDRRLSLFAAVENLFDLEYDTGRTPLRTIGMPRTAHVGVRLFLRGI